LNFESTSDALLRLLFRRSYYAAGFLRHLSLRLGFLSTTQLPYDGLLQSTEKFAEVLRETEMDVLSEVLKVVKLQGAMFYNGEFSAPWIRSPASCNVAPFVAAGAEHVIIYHLLT